MQKTRVATISFARSLSLHLFRKKTERKRKNTKQHQKKTTQYFTIKRTKSNVGIVYYANKMKEIFTLVHGTYFSVPSHPIS